MPTKDKDIPVPQSPKDIKVALVGSVDRQAEKVVYFTPSDEQYAAIRDLAVRLHEHGKKTGTHYTALAISGNEPEDAEGLTGAFATLKQNNHRVFFANIHSLMGCIATNTGLDGVIAHESGHIKANNFGAYAKMDSIVSIMEQSSELSDMLKYFPDRTKDAAVREFGSIPAIQGELERFRADVMPVLAKLEAKGDLLKTSPEAFACLMETDDPAYVELREVTKQLPRMQTLMKLQMRLTKAKEGVIQAMSGNSITLPDAPVPLSPQEARLSGTLTEIGDLGRAMRIRNFATNFAKGEEYFADSYNLKITNDPSSMSNFLIQFRKNTIPTDDPNRDQTLALNAIMEGPKHPSDTRRIHRMQSIHKDGTPPPDEELRPPIAKFSPNSLGIDPAILEKLKATIGPATDTGGQMILATKDVPMPITGKKGELGG